MKYFVPFLFLISISLSSQAVPLEKLVKKPQYSDAKISPDGKHIAVRVYDGRRYGLLFLTSDKLTKVGMFFNRGKDQVGGFYWGNNKRVVIKLVKYMPWEKKPAYFGELFSVDITGKNPELIYGYRANTMGRHPIDSARKRNINGWASLIDILPDDEKYILVASHEKKTTKPLLLNIYNGRIKKRYAKIPVPSASFLTNRQGELVYAISMDENQDRRVYIYDKKEDEWNEVPNSRFGQTFRPIILNQDEKSVYALDDHNQDKIGLFKVNLDGSEYQSIYSNPKVDISDTKITSDRQSLYAIQLDNGLPEYLFLSGNSAEAKTFQMLVKKFPGYRVNITSISQDASKMIFLVSSDTNPGAFFSFDTKTQGIKFLFSFTPQLKGEVLAKMHPFTFKNSDAMDVSGYFTAAIAKQGAKSNRKSPLVVLVHGGPHFVRDYWGFDSEVQVLATHGYSVLQVNYRGSEGYGIKFEIAGYKHWGDDIQKDIIEATQWVVKQGLVDKNKICIMGGSFGAYSAVQSATIKPDLFKCVIATAGVYDLNLLREEGDIRRLYFSESYFNDVLGQDKKAIAAISPVNYIEKLKAPVLLFHGEKDKRAPIIHAEKLIKAMKKKNKKYNWVEVDDEAHGFYDEKNQTLYYSEVLKFLDKQLN